MCVCVRAQGSNCGFFLEMFCVVEIGNGDVIG